MPSSGWFERAIESLDGLPETTRKNLEELGRLDADSRSASFQLTLEESALLGEFKKVLSDGEESDEVIEGFKARAKQLADRRAEFAKTIDKQIKLGTGIYEMLDDVINKMDQNIARVNAKLEADLDMSLDALPRPHSKRQQNQKLTNQNVKKKKATIGLDSALVGGYHANEPVYCYCRRPFFGQMVGCDNDNCKLEWFHYECVGLKADDTAPDEWFCKECAH